jgi:sulfite exporter TauE/SafE/copper chaperone CopZ
MIIENKLSKLEGIQSIDVSYVTSLLKVTFDSDKVSLNDMKQVIEKLDYKVLGEPNSKASTNSKKTQLKGNITDTERMPLSQLISIGIIILAVYLIIKQTIGFNFIPEVNPNTSFSVLFIIGMITSLHCVAMCGGINLSQSISNVQNEKEKSKFSKFKPSLLYNFGRVISYTVIGGIVGALGSVVSISGTGKAFVSIIAGAFMVIMGLNLMNMFPSLRKFNPRMPKIFARKINKGKMNKGPLVVGMLNGLMPCGPLQAMQIYALSTGSFYAGALSMFLFSLGTVPLMFGFGAISSMLTAKFTKKMMNVSALLVIVLGVVMVNRGLGLSGFSIQSLTGNLIGGGSQATNVATINGNIQEITTTLQSGSYEPISVKKGIPVKWTIQADANNLNGCNNAIVVPKYGIEKKLSAGQNVIEFTPKESGTFGYSCWMGMIRSDITVTD